MMVSIRAWPRFQQFWPWICCSSLAIGYAAYLHWKLKKLKDSNKNKTINDNNLSARDEINIDNIDRGK